MKLALWFLAGFVVGALVSAIAIATGLTSAIGRVR